MKHVLVETNFVVEVARPFPNPRAEALLSRRHRDEIGIHIPWCSVREARRTLPGIIGVDLGFTSAMMKFAGRECGRDRSQFEMTEIQKLKEIAEQARAPCGPGAPAGGMLLR